MSRTISQYIALVLKGCAMGAADVVPGVSGGTIAFISGIYQELIGSIKSIDVEAFKLLFSFRLKDFWQKVNGNFLLALFCGIAISILSLAKAMTYLLDNHPIMIWSFFFGLIISSSLLVFRQIENFNLLSAISILCGIAAAYSITVLSPAQTPNDWWFIILCGAIAICAMVLPGVSGSFILLLLGKYLYILTALSNFEITTILLFIGGALIGLVCFSHLLSWLLSNFHTATVSVLTGFMIGSLNKVWPWKEVVETTLNSHGQTIPLVERNISPQQYEAITGQESLLVWAVVMALAGFATIYLIESLGKKQESKN